MPPTDNPQNDPQNAFVLQISEYDGNYDADALTAGDGTMLTANDVGTLVLGTQQPTVTLSGQGVYSQFLIFKQVEFSAEDLPSYVGILMRAQNPNSIVASGVIVLE